MRLATTQRWDGPGEDLRGAEFGSLVVEAPAPLGERGVRVQCRCVCGRIAVRHVIDLASGAARACSICRPAESRLRPAATPRSPAMPPYFRDAAILERFFSKTIEEPNTGCLLWTAAVDKDGYGKFSISLPRMRRGAKQKQFHLRAHRFALAIQLDRWPLPHLLACHRCDVPACVNPAHLREATQRSNLAEMTRRGRTGRRGQIPDAVRPRGDRHGQTKILDAEIATILRRRARGEEVQSIAFDYRVHAGTIQAICLGRSPRVARLGLRPVKLRELRRAS